MDLHCLIWLYKSNLNSTFFPLVIMCSLHFILGGPWSTSSANVDQCCCSCFGGAVLFLLDTQLCRHSIALVESQQGNMEIPFQREKSFLNLTHPSLLTVLVHTCWNLTASMLTSGADRLGTKCSCS